TGARAVVVDGDEVAARGAPDVAAGEGQAALALVERLQAAHVVAEIEGDPAFAGFVRVGAIGGAAHQALHLLHVHADAQLGEAAARARLARDLALVGAVARGGALAACRSGRRAGGGLGGRGPSHSGT